LALKRLEGGSIHVHLRCPARLFALARLAWISILNQACRVSLI